MSLEIIVRRNAEVNAKKTTLLSFYLERRFSQNFHSTWQLETQKQTTANLFYSELYAALSACQLSDILFSLYFFDLWLFAWFICSFESNSRANGIALKTICVL